MELLYSIFELLKNPLTQIYFSIMGGCAIIGLIFRRIIKG